MNATAERTTYTRDQWLAEGHRRFGPDVMAFAFVCPVCKHVATINDYRNAGAPETAVAFNCIGRYAKDPLKAFGEIGPDASVGPCDYSGGGLFKLNPVTVIDDKCHAHHVFDFAEPTVKEAHA